MALYPEGWLKKAGDLALTFRNSGSFCSGIFIVICVIIFSLILLGVLYWGNSYVEYGFFIGLVMAFILSFGKWGITQNNTQDYFSTYNEYYARKDLVELGIIQEYRYFSISINNDCKMRRQY
ncbi:MAG: hypothetical protein WA131_06625 [Desulfitobacteriaceae bacterium]